MKFFAAGAIATLAMVMLLGGANEAGEKKDPKFKIKEVMKEAHVGGLMKKVSEGKASDEEKTKLVELYTALSQNAPPKGEEADWKKVTGTLVATAKKAAKGDEDAAKLLPKLASCKGCHSVHK